MSSAPFEWNRGRWSYWNLFLGLFTRYVTNFFHSTPFSLFYHLQMPLDKRFKIDRIHPSNLNFKSSIKFSKVTGTLTQSFKKKFYFSASSKTIFSHQNLAFIVISLHSSFQLSKANIFILLTSFDFKSNKVKKESQRGRKREKLSVLPRKNTKKIQQGKIHAPKKNSNLS